MFQKGQDADKVTLNLLINGKGTAWIDDIVLSKEPLKQDCEITASWLVAPRGACGLHHTRHGAADAAPNAVSKRRGHPTTPDGLFANCRTCGYSAGEACSPSAAPLLNDCKAR